MGVKQFVPTDPFTMAEFNKALKSYEQYTDDQLSNVVSLFGPIQITLPQTAWSGSGPWTQTVSVSGITSLDNGLNVYPVDIVDATARKAYTTAYGCLAVQFETVNGGIKFTCRDAKPSINFDVIVEGVK